MLRKLQSRQREKQIGSAENKLTNLKYSWWSVQHQRGTTAHTPLDTLNRLMWVSDKKCVCVPAEEMNFGLHTQNVYIKTQWSFQSVYHLWQNVFVMKAEYFRHYCTDCKLHWEFNNYPSDRAYFSASFSVKNEYGFHFGTFLTTAGSIYICNSLMSVSIIRLQIICKIFWHLMCFNLF